MELDRMFREAEEALHKFKKEAKEFFNEGKNGDN